MDASSEPPSDNRLDAAAHLVRQAISLARHELPTDVLERRAQTVIRDVVLLARCAYTKCLITYSDAISLRGEGNPQNGRWLDEVYDYAVQPLGFPDLTMLVVTKEKKLPSPDAFDSSRASKRSIPADGIQAEQYRCVWFSGYEDVLGPLEPIPREHHLTRLLKPQPAKDREIARAVSSAIGRISQAGRERRLIGKEYPDSLSRTELTAMVEALWDEQGGRCALTGQCFELRSDEEGGVQEDRASLDRIDNVMGYAERNVQLVTQFANRARGTLTIEEARRRLAQFGP